MTRATEAVFTGGVLRPVETLGLAENQRVRLIVQPIDLAEDREAALARLKAGIAKMQFSSVKPFPNRDALHNRTTSGGRD